MPKRSRKSDDPIISAKRALDHIVANYDPESVNKPKTTRKSSIKRAYPQKRTK